MYEYYSVICCNKLIAKSRSKITIVVSLNYQLVIVISILYLNEIVEKKKAVEREERKKEMIPRIERESEDEGVKVTVLKSKLE